MTPQRRSPLSPAPAPSNDAGPVGPFEAGGEAAGPLPAPVPSNDASPAGPFEAGGEAAGPLPAPVPSNDASPAGASGGGEASGPLPAGAAQTEPLFPTFLRLEGRKVVLVGGGTVALAKHATLVAAGAEVTIVAPQVRPELRAAGATVIERGFLPEDLDGAWFAVAAATPAVNRAVLAAALPRRIFVNAADDPPAASAFAGSVARRGPLTIAVSTGGTAPALAALVREGLEALLPADLGSLDGGGRRGPAALARGRHPDARAPPPAARGAQRPLRPALTLPLSRSRGRGQTGSAQADHRLHLRPWIWIWI